MADMDHTSIQRAADLIEDADALVVAAGAGMGIDSGLPDFRGPGGFWAAYPAIGRRGLEFYEVASSRTFETDPALAWGFYGHRLALYRNTTPHAGFGIVKSWGDRMFQGCRVFTSNVDGQFQGAGFSDDAITECHGSIHHLQCSRPCCGDVWLAADFAPLVDDETCTLVNDPPLCPWCGAIARPNIMMFGDMGWIDRRSKRQEADLRRWVDKATRIVVIELGAAQPFLRCGTSAMRGWSIMGRGWFASTRKSRQCLRSTMFQLLGRRWLHCRPFRRHWLDGCSSCALRHLNAAPAGMAVKFDLLRGRPEDVDAEASSWR